MTNQTGMFSYIAYGLGIRSTLELPELPEEERPADVVVHERELQHRPPGLDRCAHGFATLDDSQWYFFKDAGTYLVRRGREIFVDALPAASPRVVRLSLLGPAMSLALLQRGYFVLHASCVGIDGRAVVFLGGHAWGKSTVAALLMKRGHRLIADDVTAIADDGARPMVVPSFPQLKLWPDAAAVLDATELYPRLHPHLDKVGVAVHEGFDLSRAPLDRLYVLGKGPRIGVQPVAPQIALRMLLVHWYGSRFGSDLVASMDTSSHFVRCAELVSRVSVRWLLRPPTDIGDAHFTRDLERAVLADLER